MAGLVGHRFVSPFMENFNTLKQLFSEICIPSCRSWFPLKTQQRHYDKWTSRDAGSFCACDSLEATCKREQLRLVNRGISKSQTLRNVYTLGLA